MIIVIHVYGNNLRDVGVNSVRSKKTYLVREIDRITSHTNGDGIQ